MKKISANLKTCAGGIRFFQFCHCDQKDAGFLQILGYCILLVERLYDLPVLRSFYTKFKVRKIFTVELMHHDKSGRLVQVFGETVTITKVVASALEFLDTKPVGEPMARVEEDAEQAGAYEP